MICKKKENAAIKNPAFSKWLENDYDNYSELKNTLQVFENVFNIKTNWSFGNYISYIELNTNNIEDYILELSGVRLLKYLYNNYFNDLYKGEYFSLWSKKDKSFKYYKEGHAVLKSKYSKVIFKNDCVLTGVCYDDDILKPIYKFLKNPKNISFKDLLKECLKSWLKVANAEYDYRTSEEYFIEEIEANGYEFTEDGDII